MMIISQELHDCTVPAPPPPRLNALGKSIELHDVGNRAAVEDEVELDAHRENLLVVHRVRNPENLGDCARVVLRDSRRGGGVDLKLGVFRDGSLEVEVLDWARVRICERGIDLGELLIDRMFDKLHLGGDAIFVVGKHLGRCSQESALTCATLLLQQSIVRVAVIVQKKVRINR